MLAMESPFTGLGHSFTGPSNTLKNDIREVSRTSQYYVTPKIEQQLRKMENSVDHIKLDNDFMASSRDWGKKFHPSAIQQEKQGALQTLNKAASMMYDVKNHGSTRNVSNMMDNQSRELHHWTMQNLKEANKDINPYAQASADRIHQFCDRMGVTDRYTGYRHNLNRGFRDPTRLGQSWLDNVERNAYNGTLGVGWRAASTKPLAGQPVSYGMPPTYTNEQTIPVVPHPPRPTKSAPPRATRVAASADTHPYPRMTQERPELMKSIQEQCGINTTFPGHTEYMDRYTRPKSTPNIGFKINPAPNFYMHGRPLAGLYEDKCFTEYQTRYEVPDGRKITKFPWLRK